MRGWSPGVPDHHGLHRGIRDQLLAVGAFFVQLMDFDEDFGEVEMEFDLETEYELMASDPPALVDRLDLILTYGSMTPASKNSILTTLTQAMDSGVFDVVDAVHLALYLFVNSPDFAVLR